MVSFSSKIPAPPRGSLPGPSRTITVEPIELPVQTPPPEAPRPAEAPPREPAADPVPQP
jgi:hypothetical protein